MSNIPPMPPTVDRRSYDEADPNGYLESDNDWARNNPGAVEWLANNHVAIRAALTSPYLQPIEPKCACCGTTENLHKDRGSGGPYRCNSRDCMVF